MRIVEQAQITCCGEQHRIAVTDKGQVILLDCNYRRAKAFAKLGGGPTSCVEFLQLFKKWIGHTTSGAYATFPVYFEEAAVKILVRLTAKISSPVFYEDFKTRMRAKCITEFKSCLVKAGYKWQQGIRLSCTSSGCEFQIVAKNTLQIPISWLRDIYMSGLAVYKDRVVLKICFRYASGLPKTGLALSKDRGKLRVILVGFSRGGIDIR